MFYILMFLGSGLILLGICSRRIQRMAETSQDAIEVSKLDTASERFEIKELVGRMEQLEKLIFQNLVSMEEEKAVDAGSPEIAEAPEEGQAPKQPMPDSVREILDYEIQGLSLQEIAGITRMNKGEVLLLKNLSKHYSR